MYRITRPRDDGRTSFHSYRFDGNVIITDNEAAAISAHGLGWKVEKAEPVVAAKKVNKLVCDECGFEAKSQLGLNSHLRSHKEN